MRERPATLAEARAHRYGVWAGMPKGQPFTEGDCIAEFMPNERGALSRQCGNKPQPGRLWCKKHDPDILSAKMATERAEYAAHESISEANERKASALGKRLGAGTTPHYYSARRFKDSGYTKHVVVPFALVESLLKELGR